ncbi:hypothetical protein OA88_14715 [Flavobacterium sp. JRM]|nr:hypothetical protein OA88_14715 [Flavobacterium sp. JRM]
MNPGNSEPLTLKKTNYFPILNYRDLLAAQEGFEPPSVDCFLFILLQNLFVSHCISCCVRHTAVRLYTATQEELEPFGLSFIDKTKPLNLCIFEPLHL